MKTIQYKYSTKVAMTSLFLLITFSGCNMQFDLKPKEEANTPVVPAAAAEIPSVETIPKVEPTPSPLASKAALIKESLEKRTAEQDVLYQFTPSSTVDNKETSWIVTGLPKGLDFNTQTGKIFGFAEEIGTNNVALIQASTQTNELLRMIEFKLEVIGDPLAEYQWHLFNSGQKSFSNSGGTVGEDLNIRDVIRSGITGKGVRVAVSDSGIAINHEGLKKNITQNGSRNYNFPPVNNKYGGDPIPSDGDAHGTAVSGIIAESRGKGFGGHGIASGASLVGFNFLASSQSFAILLDQITSEDSTPVDIFNQSWAITSGFYEHYPAEYDEQLKYGTLNYRGGKGALYVHAAGNGYVYERFQNEADRFFISQNVNSQQFNANPYTLLVGATNAGGKKSSYSSTGAALWISGLGGEFGTETPAIVTTDLPGCYAGYSHVETYNILGEIIEALNPFEWGDTQKTLNPYCDYTSVMNGTSAATPSISAVSALMLEANPSLTWRDVFKILAKTAKQVDADIPDLKIIQDKDLPDYINEPKWLVNNSGYHFHNWYGFGRADAKAAVDMAKTFTPTVSSLGNTLKDSGAITNPGIPNKSITGKSNTINMNIAGNPKIFSVLIHVTSNHLLPTELAFELTSPTGTKSVVLNSGNSFIGDTDEEGYILGTQLTDAVFRTNAFFEEPPNGNWTLKVIDTHDFFNDFPLSGQLTNWKLDIYY